MWLTSAFRTQNPRMKVYPLQINTPVLVFFASPSNHDNHQPGLQFSNKTSLPVNTKERNFPDGSAKLLCYYVLSHLILQTAALHASSVAPILPVMFLLWEIVLGYLLRDILHCVFCSSCLLSKEVGRSETASHRGFVMLVVSPCIFLLQNTPPGKDFSNNMSSEEGWEMWKWDDIILLLWLKLLGRVLCS